MDIADFKRRGLEFTYILQDNFIRTGVIQGFLKNVIFVKGPITDNIPRNVREGKAKAEADRMDKARRKKWKKMTFQTHVE